MNMTELVVDFARYTPVVVPSELIAGGVRAAIIKVDALYEQNASICLEAGLPVIAYHWEDPITDSARQVGKTLEILRRVPASAVMVDLEQWWTNWGTWWDAIRNKISWAMVKSFSPQKISSHAYNTFGFFCDELGYRTFGYTSNNFVQSRVLPFGRWMSDYDWVLAHYKRQPTKPVDMSWDDLKRDWLPDYEPLRPENIPADRVVGHQFTGDRIGLPGMYGDDLGKRARADVNVFNKEWLDRIVGDTSDDTQEEDPPIDIPPVQEGDNSMFVGTVTASVRIRNAPGLSGSIVGGLSPGDTITVSEIASKSDGYQWVSLSTVNGQSRSGQFAATGPLSETDKWIVLDELSPSPPPPPPDNALAGIDTLILVNSETGAQTTFRIEKN